MTQRQLDRDARLRRLHEDEQFLAEKQEIHTERQRLAMERRQLEDLSMEPATTSVIDLTSDDEVIKREDTEPFDQAVGELIPEEQLGPQEQHRIVSSSAQPRNDLKKRVKTESLTLNSVAQSPLPAQRRRKLDQAFADRVTARFPTVIQDPEGPGFIELHCPDPECRANAREPHKKRKSNFFKGLHGIHAHALAHARETYSGMKASQLLPFCVKARLSTAQAEAMLNRAGDRHTIKVIAGKRAPEDSHVHKPRRRRGPNAAYVPESEIEENVEQSTVQRSLRRATAKTVAAMAADTAETKQKTGDKESGGVSETFSAADCGGPRAGPGQLGCKKSRPVTSMEATGGREELLARMQGATDVDVDEDEEPVRDGLRRHRQVTHAGASDKAALDRNAESG